MPLYTVLVTVQIATETQQDAYSDIRLALSKSKRAEIIHVDSEVIGEEPDEEIDDPSAADLQAAYQRVVRVAKGRPA